MPSRSPAAHEVRGIVLLALYRALKSPEVILGAERALRFATVDRDAWYPVSELVAAHVHVEGQIGGIGMRKIGRTTIELAVRAAGRPERSARDVLDGMHARYRSVHRGDDIGGWRVLSFEPGAARVEKTTKLSCEFEQGILDGSLRLAGCSSSIEQTSCVRTGASACVYEVYSRITDARWTG